MNLNNKIKDIPKLSGVYLFKDKKDNIIYIGKAKNLYKRVSYYFKEKNNLKIKELIKEHNSIDHIITETENSALILEAKLIQRFKPKYNILLKSGNPFLYLEIYKDRLILSKKKSNSKLLFGPFINKSQIKSVYNYLIKTFKLKICNKKIENGCLDFHLNICSGSCKKDFDIKSYKTRLEIVKNLLNDNLKDCKELLIENIKSYNKNLEFEKSKILNNYLINLDSISEILKSKFSEDRYKEQIIFKTSSKEKLNNFLKAADQLKSILKLDKIPTKIDCFDISHFQSNYIVGSCIRFDYGSPDKNSFRKFKVKSLIIQNDYQALKEIVERRYKDKNNLPDLILIDGGKGQLNSVISLNLDIKCISIAKKEETLFFYIDNNILSLILDIKTEIAKVIIEIRDYAHHFAISYHKKLRSENFII